MESSIVDRLRGIDWRRFHVLFAILHGSILWSDKPRDIDVIVAPSEGFTEEDEVVLMEVLEEVSGLPVDLHVINLDDPECHLLTEAFEHGILLYIEGEAGVSTLVRLALTCWDYMLMKKKVGYTRLLIESVLRRDGSRGTA